LLPLLFTNQGQKLSIPFGHGTTGQSKAKVDLEIKNKNKNSEFISSI